MVSTIVVSDRSRIEADEHCPRRRYWEYHWQGRGIERVGLGLDLHTGITTHDLLHGILHLARAQTFTDQALKELLSQKLGWFEAMIRQRGLALELATGWEEVDGVIQAQEGQLDMFTNLYRSWIQQSVTAWTAIRLPYYVQNYEVVSLEEEEELLMGGGQMLFLSRPDAILRRYSDGQLFILNFKTVGEPNKWWQDQWPLDMQTLSEVLPVEARLGERVSGVIIEGLVKGGKRLQYPPGSGNWWINSPLIWMWKKEGAPPFPPEYSAKFEWVGEDGKSHRLGKGWYKKPAWEDELGLEGWLQWLHENDEQTLRAQFVDLPPILRSDQACQRWEASVTTRELIIGASAHQVEVDPTLIDELFPMHTAGGNCIRPSKCSCYDLCHGIAAMDPLHNGFIMRTPNHPKELVVLGDGPVETHMMQQITESELCIDDINISGQPSS